MTPFHSFLSESTLARLSSPNNRWETSTSELSDPGFAIEPIEPITATQHRTSDDP